MCICYIVVCMENNKNLRDCNNGYVKLQEVKEGIPGNIENNHCEQMRNTCQTI